MAESFKFIVNGVVQECTFTWDDAPITGIAAGSEITVSPEQSEAIRAASWELEPLPWAVDKSDELAELEKAIAGVLSRAQDAGHLALDPEPVVYSSEQTPINHNHVSVDAIVDAFYPDADRCLEPGCGIALECGCEHTEAVADMVDAIADGIARGMGLPRSVILGESSPCPDCRSDPGWYVGFTSRRPCPTCCGGE